MIVSTVYKDYKDCSRSCMQGSRYRLGSQSQFVVMSAVGMAALGSAEVEVSFGAQEAEAVEVEVEAAQNVEA